MKPLPKCHDCAANPGEVHKPNCDVERCAAYNVFAAAVKVMIANSQDGLVSGRDGLNVWH